MHINIKNVPNVEYKYVKKVRLSCAYLFRIEIDDKYLLVKDEQGRENFQPVGGVYKYTKDDFFSFTHAVQCTRFGSNTDLDHDLRVVVPRDKLKKFEKWYRQETDRETVRDLHREFKEEIIDRIETIDPKVFETIEYKYCGEIIEAGRWGESDVVVRIADIVQLIPTPEQTKELLKLMSRKSSLYHFASKEEIYALGRVNGNQVQTIAEHTCKILPSDEKRLARNVHTGKVFKCTVPLGELQEDDELWIDLPKVDPTRNFTFISYNSGHKKSVWRFCKTNMPPLENIWIDRKNVGENWFADVERALNSDECESAILFIDKEYLVRSSSCLQEASLILANKIPHIVVLIDMDINDIKKHIKNWIDEELVETEKLQVFKGVFGYDDNNRGINTSTFRLNEAERPLLLEAYSNLVAEH